MKDELLRLALLSFPRARRARDGAVMLDCARDLVDAGGSVRREAAGLLAAGLQARAAHLAGPAAHAPWGATLDRLALPLAAVVLILFWSGAARTVLFGPLGLWWATAVVAALTAFAGAALRVRPVAVAGWAVLVAVDAYSVLTQHYLHVGPRFHSMLGSLGVDTQAAVFPLLLLGLASACALRPDGRRPLAAAALALAGAVGFAALARSQALTPPDSVTAEALLLGGLLFAPLLVAAYAAVTRRPEALAAAALLLAVAAPELVWLTPAMVMGYPGTLGVFATLVGGAAAATVAVLALARASGRRRRPA
jgi:hypothetical protein